MSEQAENQKEENVVILDQPSEPDLNEQEFDTGGLLPEELEMAKEHGLVKEETKETEDGDNTEQRTDETDEDKPVEQEETEESEEVEDKKPTFEEVEQDDSLKDKFNKNEKALFFKWKADKHKRQKAQKELEEFKNSVNLSKAKDLAYKKKLEQINDLLNKEDLTVEQIQEVIGNTFNESKTEEEIRNEVKEEQNQQINFEAEKQERIKLAEDIGLAKYDDFDKLAKLATEVVNADTSGTYRNLLEKTISDPQFDEEQLADQVVAIAKLSKDYGKDTEKEEKTVKKTNEEADRVIKNSKKKVSSASLNAGGSKRKVTFDELTADDVINMSQEQFNKLPPEVVNKLLGQT